MRAGDIKLTISGLMCSITDNGFISLESCKVAGQHVGANNGNIKPPNNTGTGRHGQWHVVLDEKVWWSLIRGVVNCLH